MYLKSTLALEKFVYFESNFNTIRILSTSLPHSDTVKPYQSKVSCMSHKEVCRYH